MKREKRANPTPRPELRAASEESPAVIVGLAVPWDHEIELAGFGEPVREVFRRGAFGAVEDLEGVIVTMEHNVDRLLGRVPMTAKLTDRDDGLWYEVEPPSNAVGEVAIESISRGDINGASFTFSVQPEGENLARDEETGALLREIVEASLFEVAPVAFPAYGAATSAEVDSRSIEAALKAADHELAARRRIALDLRRRRQDLLSLRLG